MRGARWKASEKQSSGASPRAPRAGETRVVGEDRLVHEPGAPRPAIAGLRLGKHGDEPEVRVLARPCLAEIGGVEVLAAAHAPIEDHLAGDAALEGVLEHALHRCEAR